MKKYNRDYQIVKAYVGRMKPINEGVYSKRFINKPTESIVIIENSNPLWVK